ncbi:MAG TPA: sulfatase [Thermoanaerobaculia bacterium]
MARTAAFTATLLLCLAAGCARPSRPPAQGRNVVLVVIDTLRRDHLATYGYSRDTAPFLGELARQGAVFEGITPAPWTKPATASLLTGLHPLHHQVIDRVDRLPDAAQTLAERLRHAGYHTLGVSANGWVSQGFRFDRGFDTFLFHHNAKAADLNRDLLPALERLEPPFFLYVQYVDPHLPYEPDIAWDGRPLPADLKARPVTVEEADAPHFLQRSPELMARARDLYDGEIRGVDDALRELSGWLARRGLMKSTVLVVTADHGEELGDHGRMSHGQTVYQEVLRVPLVIRAPGAVPPGRFGRASLMDVVPTLLDLLGIDRPDPLDGESLAGRLAAPKTAPENTAPEDTASENTAPDEDRAFLAHLDFVDGTGVALIRGRWKLVLGKNPYRKELFDLKADPGERRNLLGSPEAAGAFRSLGTELVERYDRYTRAALERIPIQMEGTLTQELAALGYIAGTSAPLQRRIPRRIGPPDPLAGGRLGWAGPGMVGPCAELGKALGIDLSLLSGWYEPDGTGRWSAQSASLVLGPPPGPGRPRLRVEGNNFRPRPVGVTLRVDGRPVLRSELPVGPFHIGVPLAGASLPDPTLVEIVTDSAFVPDREGLPDHRSLGLYLSRVCLRADGGP